MANRVQCGRASVRTVRRGCSSFRKVAHGSNAASTRSHAAAMCSKTGSTRSNSARRTRHWGFTRGVESNCAAARQMFRALWRVGVASLEVVLRRDAEPGAVKESTGGWSAQSGGCLRLAGSLSSLVHAAHHARLGLDRSGDDLPAEE